MPELSARYAPNKTVAQPARRAGIGDYTAGRVDVQVHQSKRVGDIGRRVHSGKQVSVFARAAQGQCDRFVALVQARRGFDSNIWWPIGAQLIGDPNTICDPIRGHAAFTYNHTICHGQVFSHTEFPNAS